jgi:tetratricopeptide (TPR) repeat protein
MKSFITIIVFAFLCIQSSAQQIPKTPDELQAYIKSLQKKADSMQNAMKNTKSTGNTNFPSGTTMKTTKNSDNNYDIQLPKKDTGRIKKITSKNFTATQLHSYCNDLYNQLSKKLPQAAAVVQSTFKKLGSDPTKLGEAAIIAWNNGALEDAVLLSTYAASLNSADGITISNTAAILDMGGLSEYAIPVLRTIVRYDPENAMALNNLGQAFTNLGLVDSALYYFSRCLSLSPQHPEANNTAGIIELKKGNQAKAQTYFENSIRGGFTHAAYLGLKSILKDKCRIRQLIKPKIKYPDYFNQFKYKLPRQCLNVNEAATRKAEFEDFKKMLSKTIREYNKLEKDVEQQMGKDWAMKYNQATMDKIMAGKPYMRPFQVMGAIMEGETVVDYTKDLNDLEKFNKENRQQYKDLEAAYKKDLDQLYKSGSHNCSTEIALKNKYLLMFAQLNEEWQSRNLHVYNTYIDDFLFWGYFAAADENDAKHRFYHWAGSYLYNLNVLAQIKILEPCEQEDADEYEKQEPGELKNMDCPAKLSIPLSGGKLDIDCEKFSFKAGEGILFRVEHNYVTKQTTWSVGLGAELYDGPANIGGKEVGGLDAKIHMSVYLTVDRFGNVADAGLISEVKGSAKYGFEGSTKLKLKEDIGWRIGINTGFSMNEGRLKNLIDKTFGPEPEVQPNKKIKTYKPN